MPMSEEDRKRIEKIIWRLNVKVVEQMKRIPSRELFGWKKDKNEPERY